jgi:hypothetical protein
MPTVKTKVLKIPTPDESTSPLSSDMSDSTSNAEQTLEAARLHLRNVREQNPKDGVKEQEKIGILRTLLTAQEQKAEEVKEEGKEEDEVKEKKKKVQLMTAAEIGDQLRISLNIKKESTEVDIITETKLQPSNENLQTLLRDSSFVVDDLRSYYEKLMQRIVDCMHLTVITKLKGVYFEAQLRLFTHRGVELSLSKEFETRCNALLKVPFSRINTFSQKFDIAMYQKYVDKDVEHITDKLIRYCKKELDISKQNCFKCNFVLNEKNNQKIITTWKVFFQHLKVMLDSKVTHLVQGYKQICEDFYAVLLKIDDTVKKFPFSIQEQTNDFTNMLNTCLEEDDWKIHTAALSESIPEIESFILPTTGITHAGPTIICSYLKKTNPAKNYIRCGSIEWDPELTSILEPILQFMKDQFSLTVKAILLLELKIKSEYSTVYNSMNGSILKLNKKVQFIRQDIIQSIQNCMPSSESFMLINQQKFTLAILDIFTLNQIELLQTVDSIILNCKQIL